MKITKIAMLILAIAIALYVLVPSLSWADGTARSPAKGPMSHPIPTPPG